MKLTFKDLKQQKFVIEAEPSELISDVKAKIAEEKGWDAAAQKLIYSGKILQDANTVESYKIEEKGFIVCMVSKPKAPPAAAKPPATPAPAVVSTPAAPAAPAPVPAGSTSTIPSTPTPAGAAGAGGAAALPASSTGGGQGQGRGTGLAKNYQETPRSPTSGWHIPQHSTAQHHRSTTSHIHLHITTPHRNTTPQPTSRYSTAQHHHHHNSTSVRPEEEHKKG